MTALAALTGPLPKAGVVVVAALAAVVLLAPDRRLRAAATLGALVLAGALLLSEIWHTQRLAAIRHHPLEAAVAAAVGLAVLAGAAALLYRRRGLVAPLAVLTLPFRVPVQAGGITSNLLVPLYFVIAAGALAEVAAALRPPPRADQGPVPQAAPEAGLGRLAVWLGRLLALSIVLYAVQATYSAGFTKALQNMVFFYVPFALLYRLLRDLPWTARLVRACLGITAGLAVAFSVIGFYEYATKTIILNSRLAAANNVHTYFTVNSVFLDPDILGRYLALVMILLAVLLIYDRRPREQGGVTVTLAVLWAGLVLTLSRSSLGALLVGLAVLAALRWRPSRALVVAVVVVAAGAVAVAATPTTFGLNQGINGASSGRGGLVSGGLSLFADRPGWGYGSGSFSAEYKAHNRRSFSALSASHTIPVTVAAEQGIVGEIVYLALVVCAIACLVRGARGDPVRAAVAAAFVALWFHTLLYADFLEDPTTWVLLALGAALAGARAGPAAGAAGPGRGRRGGRRGRISALADRPRFAPAEGGT